MIQCPTGATWVAVRNESDFPCGGIMSKPWIPKDWDDVCRRHTNCKKINARRRTLREGTDDPTASLFHGCRSAGAIGVTSVDVGEGKSAFRRKEMKDASPLSQGNRR